MILGGEALRNQTTFGRDTDVRSLSPDLLLHFHLVLSHNIIKLRGQIREQPANSVDNRRNLGCQVDNFINLVSLREIHGILSALLCLVNMAADFLLFLFLLVVVLAPRLPLFFLFLTKLFTFFVSEIFEIRKEAHGGVDGGEDLVY